MGKELIIHLISLKEKVEIIFEWSRDGGRVQSVKEFNNKP